jgi:hypothetical protein
VLRLLIGGSDELPPGEPHALRDRVLRGLDRVPPEVRARVRRLLAEHLQPPGEA